MLKHETYRNDRISSDDLTDLAGNTVKRPYYGDTNVGDQLFPDRVVYNLDDTVTEPLSEGDVVSRVVVCACCGIQIDRKKDLVLQGNEYVCKRCVDAPGRGE